MIYQGDLKFDPDVAPESSKIPEAVQNRKSSAKVMTENRDEDDNDADYGDVEELVLAINSFKPIYLI